MSTNSMRQNVETVKGWIQFMEYKYPNYKAQKKKAKKMASLRKQYGMED